MSLSNIYRDPQTHLQVTPAARKWRDASPETLQDERVSRYALALVGAALLIGGALWVGFGSQEPVIYDWRYSEFWGFELIRIDQSIPHVVLGSLTMAAGVAACVAIDTIHFSSGKPVRNYATQAAISETRVLLTTASLQEMARVANLEQLVQRGFLTTDEGDEALGLIRSHEEVRAALRHAREGEGGARRLQELETQWQELRTQIATRLAFTDAPPAYNYNN